MVSGQARPERRQDARAFQYDKGAARGLRQLSQRRRGSGIRQRNHMNLDRQVVGSGCYLLDGQILGPRRDQ